MYDMYPNYSLTPNNVAAKRSSGGERNRWRNEGVEPEDMFSPDEVAWRREVAAKTESLGSAVGVLVLEQTAEA